MLSSCPSFSGEPNIVVEFIIKIPYSVDSVLFIPCQLEYVMCLIIFYFKF